MQSSRMDPDPPTDPIPTYTTKLLTHDRLEGGDRYLPPEKNYPTNKGEVMMNITNPNWRHYDFLGIPETKHPYLDASRLIPPKLGELS